MTAFRMFNCFPRSKSKGNSTMSTSSKPITERFQCRNQYELQVVLSSSPPSAEAVKRVILVIHGRGDTLVFQYNGLDKGEYQRDSRGTDRLLVWKGNNWGEGGGSQYPHGSNTSSFEVLDDLVSQYGRRDRFPQLEHIVIVGHSMGGQLIQRYSVLGQPSSQVPLSYVVMNSSTFLYLNNEEYKYGLRDISQTLSYYPPALVDVNQLQRRIASRRVHYLQGASDKGVGDDRADAMKQGRDRQERLSKWKAYLDNNGLSSSASFNMIPNASHDAGQMISSPVGINNDITYKWEEELASRYKMPLPALRYRKGRQFSQRKPDYDFSSIEQEEEAAPGRLETVSY